MNSSTNKPTRTVHLGVYGVEGMNIIAAVKNLALSASCCSDRDKSTFRSCEFDRADDGEIRLNAYDDAMVYGKSIFAENSQKSDRSIRRWLARCVKSATKLCANGWIDRCFRSALANECEDWQRNSEKKIKYALKHTWDESSAVEFAVSHAYALYEKLQGRQIRASAYAEDAVSSAVGEPYDPVRTELETFRREELARLNSEYAADKKSIEKWCSDEYAKIYNEKLRRLAVVKAEYERKVAELNAEVESSLGAAEAPAEAPAAQRAA